MGSTVGGGGLVSIPFLIFTGLPPQVAIATDRFGSVGQALIAFYKFWKAKKIVWKYVAILSILSIVGSIIGANILLKTKSEILTNVIGIILILLLPFIFIKKDIGIKRKKVTRLKMIIGLVIYFLIQTFTGFFGGGTGTLIFYTLMIAFGYTIIEANATNNIPWILLAISSFIIFAINGIVDYKIGTILLLGMITGGYIGAHVAIKKGDKWVKTLFAVLVIISGIKLLFF
tara:strand:- start:128 stop:817 length:690 start_codon:yes stop_codon:yes gene_type:complete